MPNYSEWNTAIHRYFVESNALGTNAFLGIDDDSLRMVGRSLRPDIPDAVEDFCEAVRDYCVIRKSVRLYIVHGRAGKNTAGGAFLALLVLAATRMSEDEAASATAYFARLRQLLGFAPAAVGEETRPPGLAAGDEVSLWNEWNKWVQERGFVPSARPGEAIQNRYRGYAIGQSLLRDVDKENLRKTFVRHRFGTLLDDGKVMQLTRRASNGLTAHLRELIYDERCEAATDRIFEVYEEWSETRHQEQREAGEKSNLALGQPNRAFVPAGKTLFCGLLRREHPFTGAASYHLLPRLRSHHGARAGQLRLGDDWLPLRPLDGRWWHDIGPIDESALAQGQLFPIRGEDGQDHVYAGALLPARDCWALVPDTTWGSADYASWREPRLGEPFVLLARLALFKQLEGLRGRVLDWSGTPEPLEELPEWGELSGISIVATDWSQIKLASDSLLEALRPRQYVHLSLAGGLRMPGRPLCWLRGYAPTLQVHAVPFMKDLARVELFAPGRDKPQLFELAPNISQILPMETAGVWRIEAQWMGSRAQSIVEIVDWEAQKLAPAPPEPASNWGQWSWRGAHAQTISYDAQNGGRA